MQQLRKTLILEKKNPYMDYEIAHTQPKQCLCLLQVYSSTAKLYLVIQNWIVKTTNLSTYRIRAMIIFFRGGILVSKWAYECLVNPISFLLHPKPSLYVYRRCYLGSEPEGLVLPLPLPGPVLTPLPSPTKWPLFGVSSVLPLVRAWI